MNYIEIFFDTAAYSVSIVQKHVDFFLKPQLLCLM